MRKKKKSKKRLLIKFILSSIYLLIIFVLCYSSFQLYREEEKIVAWKDVETTDQYSYLEISEMSEAFAEIPEENKQIHFVIEKLDSGEWYTYLVAIKKEDYNKYKHMIDYSYDRTEVVPDKIKIYGYPIKINDNIKDLAIKNIKNFVPIENEVVLTNENFEQYLTNTYLDTTLEKTHEFNYFVMILLFVALGLFILLIFTVFDKDKIVDEVDHIIEDDLVNNKKDNKKIRENNKKELNNKKKPNKITTNKKESNSKIDQSKKNDNKKLKNNKTNTKKSQNNSKGKVDKKETEEEIEVL